jgi:hypothetical protein
MSLFKDKELRTIIANLYQEIHSKLYVQEKLIKELTSKLDLLISYMPTPDFNVEQHKMEFPHIELLRTPHGTKSDSK